MLTLLTPPAAIVLDALLGDPPTLPHPVRLIGLWLEKLEACLRRIKFAGYLGGVLAVILTAGIVGLAVKLLTSIPLLGVLTTLYFAWAGLSLGQLVREGRRVHRHLASHELEEARNLVGRLVSRDVSNMDAVGLRRALAESMSENLSDAFVAPFFFLCIAGPAGLWVQRAVSTMDSMWGYRTEKYSQLGWAAARLDDVFCFIPARLTSLAMLGAGALLGLDWRNGYDHVMDDAAKSESVNAGWPMATAAWLLGASMGGKDVYFGETKDKPVMGPEGEWTDMRLTRLLKLVVVSALISAAVLYLYVWALA
ncbi:MAG: adenosylcobinamide-phosphate synthase CbiB [Desulfovibrionaceae bacterium]